jgi:hypothetical protein
MSRFCEGAISYQLSALSGFAKRTVRGFAMFLGHAKSLTLLGSVSRLVGVKGSEGDQRQFFVLPNELSLGGSQK